MTPPFPQPSTGGQTQQGRQHARQHSCLNSVVAPDRCVLSSLPPCSHDGFATQLGQQQPAAQPQSENYDAGHDTHSKKAPQADEGPSYEVRGRSRVSSTLPSVHGSVLTTPRLGCLDADPRCLPANINCATTTQDEKDEYFAGSRHKRSFEHNDYDKYEHRWSRDAERYSPYSSRGSEEDAVEVRRRTRGRRGTGLAARPRTHAECIRRGAQSWSREGLCCAVGACA